MWRDAGQAGKVMLDDVELCLVGETLMALPMAVPFGAFSDKIKGNGELISGEESMCVNVCACYMCVTYLC